MSEYNFSDQPGLPYALQRLAREQTKLHLLQDIRLDLEVCRLEGFDVNEYLDELFALIEEFRDKQNGEAKN